MKKNIGSFVPQKILYLALYLGCFASRSNAQIVIDWNKSHWSPNMDYIGWDNQDWSATIVNGNQFKITKKSNHVDWRINYVNWDGSRWSARLNGDNFVHAPDGHFNQAHEGAYMDYIANDNSHCRVTISGDNFIIQNMSTGQNYTSASLYYITWDASVWTATLAKPNFEHWLGIAQYVTRTTNEIQYLTWNSSKWTVRILANGSFQHTNETGESHLDKNIIYLNYDRSFWGARIAGNGFNHAVAFIPDDPNIWQKLLHAFSNIDIHGGFPANQPADPNKGEFRGTIEEETSQFLYYRPLDDMGQCTYDLNWIPESKIIRKDRIGTCGNRTIYSFTYQK